MNKHLKLFALVCSCLLGGPRLAAAHHSFAAIFDKDRPITLNGVLTRVDWTNPHMFFHVDVTNSGGQVEHWAFESYPPSMMARQGWNRDTVKPGDRVTVTGWRTRNGDRPLAGGNKMTLPDGRVLAIGATSEAENGEPQ